MNRVGASTAKAVEPESGDVRLKPPQSLRSGTGYQRLGVQMPNAPGETSHERNHNPSSVESTPSELQVGAGETLQPASDQKGLRAFYELFGRLGLTMINEATLEECLNAGTAEIDRLHEAARSPQPASEPTEEK